MLCSSLQEIYNICKLLNEHAPSHANEARTMESTTKFIKNRPQNAAEIDEIELESLAEILDHLIQHVIEEINVYDFPKVEDNQSHM